MAGCVYRFGPFQLDTQVRRLTRSGEVVPLTAKLFDILLLLVEGGGRLITKEELMSKIWADRFVEENNLPASISALRRLLGERRGGREYIETVPTRGYRFVGRLVGEEGPEKSKAAPQTRSVEINQHEEISSLAVLPFVNLAEDRNLDYLVDGITESIINSLSKLPQLRVMARSSVFRMKGREADATEVGAELGVRAVLVGRVRQVEGHLIIGVELVRVVDGTQLWGERYDRQPSDIFAVQREITEKILNNLRLKLTGEQRMRLVDKYTSDLEAYNLYLIGRHFWNRRTEKGIRKGIHYFEEAIKRDENFAPAHVGLAGCFTSLTDWNILPADETFPRARYAATRALEIDSTLAEAYAVLGVIDFYSWNWLVAKKEFEQAITLTPNSAQVYLWYSTYWMAMGDLDEALAAAQQSLMFDPLSPLIYSKIARVLLSMKQYKAALEHCYQAIELDENFAAAHEVLGFIYSETGAYEEAVSKFNKVLALTDDTEVKGLLGYTYAISGKYDKALGILRDLQQQSEERYIPKQAILFIHIGLGNKEETFELLESMYKERSHVLGGLNSFPIFDSLRSDTRFIDLTQRIGLQP